MYVYTWKRNRDGSHKCTLGPMGEFNDLMLIDGWESFVGERERNEKKPGM